jgi:AcrR family transcriptional regulator
MPRRAGATKAPTEETRKEGAGKARRRDAEVIDVAATIFYERGYATATVQDVADALGMLKGSLYYYIDSKEDLLYRLMIDIHDGVDHVLAEVMETQDISAADRLELYVRRAIEYNARNLKKISVYYHDIDQLTGPRRKEILTRRRAHDEYVTKLIRQAQADGDVDARLDAKLLNNCVFATIIWMYRWYKPGRGVSIEELSDTSARFVRYGLKGKPTGRASSRKAR